MGMPANNDTPIMGNCLSCQGLVRVPATAPTNSTVKCPHCNESFRLSQILNNAVPELKIVEETVQEEQSDEEVAVKDSDGRFVVAKQLRQSSKRSRRGRRRSRSRRHEDTEGMVPIPKATTNVESELVGNPDIEREREADRSQFAVGETRNEGPRESFDSRRSSSSSSGRSSSRDRSSSRSRRPASREPNAFYEIIKVVIGGEMAIPIAYLLVLWVFKQDPLHVAPKIYQTAPYLLPAQFQVEETPSAEGDGDSEVGDDEGEPVDEVLDVSG